jgi:release factor glutamine methyltransferase
MNVLLDEVTRAARRLAAAGVESPRGDAEQIAAHVHGVPRGMLHTVPDGEFDARFWVDVARREAREPLQHIVGRAYFRYLELEVGPGVFVPRPETEVMTGWAIDRLRAMDAVDPLVVDLGTGSAAIALAIAQEVPRARVHAVEADASAHAWAERNVARLAGPQGRAATGIGPRYAAVGGPDAGGPGAAGADFGDRAGAVAGPVTEAAGAAGPAAARRVVLHLDDLAAALPELDGCVDLVISNPPYIPDGAHVPPEVAEYDPPAALWGGPDGLGVIRLLERTAGRLLRPGGLVAVEHGCAQGDAVCRVFPEDGGWCDARNHKDLARKDRFVTARRAAEDGPGARYGHGTPGPWQDGPL